MKTILSIIVAVGLLLIPFAITGQAEQPGAPPVAQPLVREGEFAVKLADTLKVGPTNSEAEAENILASAGIAPKNGWIADYPLTPDIIGELQGAIGEAADSQRLAMSRDEALNAFQNLTTETGLSVAADTRGEVVQNEPPGDYSEYQGPEVINNYYYDQGPPVVTYYPPPWDYYYMYAWVPYPFWFSSFWFPGFFVLHDFHRPIFVHNRPCFVSNHFRDPRTHRLLTIDPAARHTGGSFRADAGASRRGGFPSAEAHRGAASIFERSRSNPSHTPASRGNSPPAFNNRSGFERPSTTGRNRGEAGSRGPTGRTFSQQRGFGGSFRSPSIGSGRSFSPPSGGVGRSFNAPSTGSRGSFGSSLRAPQGGGRSGGVGRGGFSLR